MDLNLKKYKDNLLFVPLGGSGEIGMNVNLYYLDGKWLMVDLGAGFADDWLPGVDMMVADIDFIKERRKDLLGIVLTHAHEDHLGAIPYLWDELQVPVYATKFTSNFLQEKLSDFGYNRSEVPITVVEEGSKLNLGPFNIELVHITHSVPEMNAVFLRTKHGNILHTGDWKFDPDPLVGTASDESKLRKLGEEGVLALIGDSTNVFSPGTSGSEGELRKSMVSLVADCKQLVVVTTFASNVARFDTILYAAKKAGRKVAIAGRSLHRIKRAAQDSGYLLDTGHVITTREIKNYPRDKVLVISTGCQGEPLAATNKLATDTHNDFKLAQNDTIIFSSKIIPGNEKKIFRLFNMLAAKNIEVITERDHFVHVSGHPNQDELKAMYEMIKPDLAIPVHGELVHMREHVRLAKIWGVKQGIVTGNGDVIVLNQSGETKSIGKVKSGYQAIDGNSLISPDGAVMRMRRRIQRDGAVSAVLILTEKGRFHFDPILMTPGSLDKNEDADLYEILTEEIKGAVEDSVRQSKQLVESNVENVTRSAIRRIYKSEIGKVPPIEVIVNIV